LPGTNGLSYFDIDDEKFFKTLTPGVNVLKRFFLDGHDVVK
jgi:hypothetical protein